MIEWFSKNEKKAVATIYPTNITINKVGVTMLDDAYAAMLGLDSAEAKIAIQPISKDQYDEKSFPEENMFTLSGGKTYSRISSTEFVNRIGDFLSYNFKQAPKKYICHFDKQTGLLIIDLKKEVL